MKRKHRFIRTVIADTLFVVGLTAIVVGIAAAGYWPLAVSVAGVELIGTGLLMARSGGEDGESL